MTAMDAVSTLPCLLGGQHAKFLDAKELAKRLHVTVATVHAWHRRGGFRAYGLGDDRFYSMFRRCRGHCGSEEALTRLLR